MPTEHLALPDALTTVSRRGLHETVLTQLLMAIRNGHFQPGQRLLEGEIAERMGLSRGTVREAIRRLEQEGLVTSRPHRGVYITRISGDEAREIFSLRRVLESFAIELAVPNVTPEALKELTETVQGMVRAAERADEGDHRRIDLQFHEQLCLLARHQHLYKAWGAIALKIWLIYFDQRRGFEDDQVQRAAAHFELIEILRQADPVAAKAWVERHIDNRARRIIEYAADQLSGGEQSEEETG